MTASFRSLQRFRMGRFSALNFLKSCLTDLDGPVMSALGQKQTLQSVRPMFVLPPKADIAERDCHVRFVPKADIAQLAELPGRVRSMASSSFTTCCTARSAGLLALEGC